MTQRFMPALFKGLAGALGFRCRLCGEDSGNQAICSDCLRGLPWLWDACPQCALPVSSADTCGRCQRSPPAWSEAVTPLSYEFPADRLVTAFKFRRDLAAGAALALAMVNGKWPRFEACNSLPLLVPVPLHWTRATWRGFNQATELAVQLSTATGWPLSAGLRRCRRTPPQSGLSATLRRRNLKDAFRWKGPDLDQRTVILVDDVMTTGATASACTRALCGADRIIIWAACRAVD